MPGNISQHLNMPRTMHAVSPNSSDSAPHRFDTSTMSHNRDGVFSGYHASGANQQGILAASSDISFSAIDPYHRATSSAPGTSISAASGASRREHWSHAGTPPYRSSSRSRSHKAVGNLRSQSAALPSPQRDIRLEITKINYYQTNRPIWATVLGLQSHIVHFHTWERPFMTISPQEFGQWHREALAWHGERSSEVPEVLGKRFMMIIIRSY